MAYSLNWLELPNHIHALFMNKLSSITDYIHFGAVCRSWRSVFDHYIQLEKIPRLQLPLLLIPSSSSTSPMQHHIDDEYKEENKTVEEQRSVYSISQRKIYDLAIKLPYNILCRGSSYGWLLTVEEDEDFSVRLFNPFLSVNHQIQLPALKTFCLDDDPVYHGYFLARTILSQDPILSSSSNTKADDNEDDLVVVAIYGQHYRLAFCKPGDESWTCLPYELLKHLADVTYYKGMLYTVGWEGQIVAFDLHAFLIASTTEEDQYYPKPKVVLIREVAPSPLNGYGGVAKYIVKSSGDHLLQVQRFFDPDDDDYINTTIRFQVFKLVNEGEEKCKWEEVKSLQGQSLFLGDNASMSLTASEFSGCMPNCIYFTDDFIECYDSSQATDLGVFNLIDGSVEQHYPIKPGTSIWPPPIWVLPTLNTNMNVKV